ncbi:hypothetical protein KIW84_022351 [Lathyrus oleraceus]|uniref:Uncharacterized protein n=1 Tax=Pisum sativum TaxID=3888 RepID=A0A9D5B9V0_PEA|nr:hypothetical protein KIW84_022350 [Pisum sativum]KAI5435891.1 hypothetical protein KIW84_022351 [Pisum sativum]
MNDRNNKRTPATEMKPVRNAQKEPITRSRFHSDTLARLLFPRSQLLFKRRRDEALGFSPKTPPPGDKDITDVTIGTGLAMHENTAALMHWQSLDCCCKCNDDIRAMTGILGVDFHLTLLSVVQSLNSASSAAHIYGVVHITPGFLPKSLHTLNLSRNKISTIEGLRELTRLRVLDPSYNRISRIGQGLSNCTPVKELYLAGNKISDVEGLHRLLKLKVLDLSFNKITTTKALGQLVANYNSLQALNLLGNPIQSNIGDEQLRKAVCGLLPKLVYLNKDVVKPQRAREMLTDSVAKAVLGNSRYVSSYDDALRVVACLNCGIHFAQRYFGIFMINTGSFNNNHLPRSAKDFNSFSLNPRDFAVYSSDDRILQPIMGFNLEQITAAGTDGFPALIKLLPNPEQF